MASWSLRTKIVLSVQLTIMIVLCLSTMLHIQDMKENLLKSIEETSDLLAQHLLSNIKTITRYYTLNNYDPTQIHGVLSGLSINCQRLFEENRKKNITHIAVIDTSGLIVAHNEKALWNRPITTPLLLAALQSGVRTMHIDYDSGTFHALIPVMVQQNLRIATIDIGFPKNIVDRKIQKIIVDSAVLLCIFIILTYLSITILIHFIVAKPIQRIVSLTQKISGGDFSGTLEQQDITRSDEIGVLGKKFVTMQEEIYEREMERDSADKALRASEERFRRLAENAQDFIFRMTLPDGHYEYASPAAVKILGYTPEELYRNPLIIQTVIHPDWRDYFDKEWQNLARGNMPPTYEFQIVAKSGKVKWINQRNVLLTDIQGKPIAIEGIVSDITEKKKMEADKIRFEQRMLQTQKYEAIGNLAGGVAHDFNNILGIILGHAELASDDVPEWNPASRNLKQIIIAGLRAKDVVRQLLIFSRKTGYEKKPLKLPAIIRDSIQLLRASIPATIVISTDIPDDCGTILADQTQMHQLMLNLCANAAHAMEERGGELEIRLSQTVINATSTMLFPELNPGRYLQLIVSDNGTGIDPKIKDKIFDPYFTTKAIGKGTGIGLSVVLGIIKSHQGAISVYSELNTGTTVKVLLPIIDDIPVEEQKEAPALPCGNEKILFIDDEEAIVRIGKATLERLGYQVTTQTNPLEALDLIRRAPHAFDLIITDMTMPQMTGKQLIQEVRALKIETPIIICTGFSEKINGDSATQIGAKIFIEKPLNRQELAISARKALDEKGT